jgi:hypothetical protein
MSLINDERPQVNEVYAKLILAKKAFKPVFKNRQGHNYKYADLETIFDAIRDALEDQDLLLIQQGEVINGLDYIRTIIVSGSGEEVDFGVTPIKAVKPDAQSFGSGLTYARRYAVGMALGLTPEDDDDGKLASIASPVDALRQQVVKLGKECMDAGVLGSEVAGALQNVKAQDLTEHQARLGIDSLTKILELTKKGKA